METKRFKCKDEVIYRIKDDKESIWIYGIFSHYLADARIYSKFVNYPDTPKIAIINGIALSLEDFDILPYKGNEGLVGTNYDYHKNDEIFVYRLQDDIIGYAKLGKGVVIKNGEIIIVFNSIDELSTDNIYLHRYPLDGIFLYNCRFKISEFGVGSTDCFIRFSDFNPGDMEETKKHILCVRNGKIVRYRP